MKQQCALCEVRTNSLSTIQTNFSFRWLTPDVTFFACEGCWDADFYTVGFQMEKKKTRCIPKKKVLTITYKLL